MPAKKQNADKRKPPQESLAGRGTWVRIPDIYELKVTLMGTKPPIWRRVTVPSDIRLEDLHIVIQVVMGWTNSHLHQFMDADKNYYQPTPPKDWGLDLSGCREKLDTADFELRQLLTQPKQKLIYEYDFGDSWEHKVELVKITPPFTADGKPHTTKAIRTPVCLAGKGACPPEDCGGVWGYYHMLEVIQDPNHEEHSDLVDWLGEDFNPEAVDIEEINAALRQFKW